MQQIPLSRGMFALVDDEDFERLSCFRWTAYPRGNTFYAIRKVRRADGGKSTSLMHREIIGAIAGFEVDHCDGDGLNNCKGNLRIATHSQNSQNRKKNANKMGRFKGVRWYKSKNKWAAIIQCNKQVFFIGLFDSEEDAAKSYDAAAKIHHGEFARVNFE